MAQQPALGQRDPRQGQGEAHVRVPDQLARGPRLVEAVEDRPLEGAQPLRLRSRRAQRPAGSVLYGAQQVQGDQRHRDGARRPAGEQRDLVRLPLDVRATVHDPTPVRPVP